MVAMNFNAINKNRDTDQFMTLDTTNDKVVLTDKEDEKSKWQLVPKGEYYLIKIFKMVKF